MLCAGGIYVLSSLRMDTSYVLSTLPPNTSYGGKHAGVGDESPVPPPYASNARRVRRSSPPVGGGVPAWARAAPRPRQNVRSAPEASYEVTPDYGHAELETPSASAGMLPRETARSEGSSLDRRRSRAERAPLTVDLGGRGAEGGTEWRSAASTLNGRLRALNGVLAGMNGADGSLQPTESRARDSRSSDEASTASSGSGPSDAGSSPDTPEDPNQVPLGGTEWLAAAGAAYALNRLRTEGGDGGESEGES